MDLVMAFAQVVSLSGQWKFRIGDDPHYSAVEWDDSKWKNMYAPTAWEEEGYNGYDGFAWYRKKFDGHELDRSESYILNLGFIDDCDEIYLNGRLIGFSGSMPPNFKTAYNSERKYAIPQEAINFQGVNTIAIRVFDVTQGGGIIDGRIGIYEAERNHLLLNLQGVWSFTKEDQHAATGDWKKINVPGPWEHQGYYKYDGFARYKRTFTLPKDFTNEPLILLLGKIDDFDKTYLNGQVIGSTNDHREYGDSESFSKLRAYPIPEKILKRNAVNTIEVIVEDMGNIGGIYEGPIGITTSNFYRKYFKE